MVIFVFPCGTALMMPCKDRFLLNGRLQASNESAQAAW